MAPRPENCENDEAYISSTCSEDDCAQLVRPGQLDTFTHLRKEKLEEKLYKLHAECDATYGSPHSLKTPSEVSSDRGRTTHRSNLNTRRAKSQNARLAIDIGDRVIVKEKYRGTCRYIGPLQEKYIVPDIFIGVQLDQQLTNNSGIFGSRQYFDCPYGYGLMVSADKVRKLKTPKMDSQFDKRTARRSKSVADLTRLLNTRNWFNDDRQIKVSSGYKALSRSKSSSNLSNPNAFDDGIHPREVLNKIKRYQPHVITGSEYGYHPYSGQYNTLPNLRRIQSNTDHYGLPLQYPTNQREEYLYSDGDLLRQSFARIVVPSMTPPPPQQFQQYMSYGSGYAPVAANESATTFSSGFYDSRSEVGFNQYLPEVELQRFNSLNGYESNKTSRTNSHDDQQKALLEWYRASQNLCETCAACQTCGPARRNFAQMRFNQVPKSADQVSFHDNVQKTYHENVNKPYHENVNKTYHENVNKTYHENVNRTYHENVPRHQESEKQREVPKERISQKQRKSILTQELPQVSNICHEYEKWKSRHGITMGRSMKKGLCKLQNAAQI